MSGSGVQRCRRCGRHFQWLRTKWGAALPFNLNPVPIEQVTDDTGWALGHWTIKRQRIVAAAPLPAYPDQRRSRFQQAITLHECAPFHAAIARVLAYARRSGNRSP
jgi:hypothetical protein